MPSSITYVTGGATTGQSTAPSYSVNSNLTYLADDLIVSWILVDSATGGDVTLPTGYTEIWRSADTGGRDRSWCFAWRKATNTSADNILYSVATASEEFAFGVMIFRGVDYGAGDPIATAVVTNYGTNNGTPTIPNITCGATDQTIVAVAGITVRSSRGVTGCSATGYTDESDAAFAQRDRAAVWMGHREGEVGAVGATASFSGSPGVDDTEEWCVAQVAFQSSDPTTVRNFIGSGTATFTTCHNKIINLWDAACVDDRLFSPPIESEILTAYATETFNAADDYTKGILSGFSQATDTFNGADDNTTRWIEILRNSAETLNLSDDDTKNILQGFGITGDTLNLSDDDTKNILAATGFATETLNLAVLADDILSGFAQATDTVNLADDDTKAILSGFASATAGINLADDQTDHNAQLGAAAADTLNLADDNTIAHLIGIAAATDGIDLADTAAGGIIYPVSADETLNFSDTAVSEVFLRTLAADGIDLGDLPAVTGLLRAVTGDGVAFSDDSAATAILMAALADGINVSDQTTRFKWATGAITEALQLSDLTANDAILRANAAAGLDVNDTPTANAVLYGLASDQVNVDEAIGRDIITTALTTDGVKLADQVEYFEGIIEAYATSGITVADTANVQATLTALASETANFADTVSAIFTSINTCADGVKFDETVTQEGYIAGFITESLQLADDGQSVSATLYATAVDNASFAATVTNIAQMFASAAATLGLREYAAEVSLDPQGRVSVTVSLKKVSVTFTISTPSATVTIKKAGSTTTYH